jgi:hypothetical protein
MRGTDVGAMAGESAGRENRARGILKRGGSAASVAAAQLGISDMFSKEDLANMAKSSPEAMAAGLLQRVGITDPKAINQLTTGIKSIKSGAVGTGVDHIDSKVLSPEDRKKLKESKEEQENPTMAAIKKNTEKMVEVMEKVEKHSATSQSTLFDIWNVSKKKVEES